MEEIKELNIKIAHEQLSFKKKDEYDYRVEQLQAQGIDVFHSTKGIEHYKQFYKELKQRSIEEKVKDKPKTIINPENQFLEG
jgi:predicted DNA binding protein